MKKPSEVRNEWRCACPRNSGGPDPSLNHPDIAECTLCGSKRPEHGGGITKAEIQTILDRATKEVESWPKWLRSPDVEARIRALRGGR